ncbi:ROK family protein [Aristophania vespae]|uniref:N-acetylglucosamine kinase n=1 Tax=Aristophania vespae TaxID=2697033 RepID=A0A6P1NHT8_9PROT|nr:ROK family protein [Aristophania vespae]QHI96094.1 ROK family protein [Aristophania vespae]UMM63863.1 N-acetyl-D-glucosamine kinase [Aristophania vespae]
MSDPILCADVGGSFISMGVFTPGSALVREKQKRPTPTQDLEAFINAFREMSAPYPNLPLHIAIAGLSDPETGLCKAANIKAINGIKLREVLEKSLSRPVRVGNDADCFALAEAREGAAKGHSNIFGIILGTGTGGGLILNDKLIVGRGGYTGEWGHGPFIQDMQGKTPYFQCGCGLYGCLETIGNARGLEHLHHWHSKESLNSFDILSNAHRNEPAASKTVSLFISYLSSALAVAVNITGASIVPVGGGLSNDKALIKMLDEEVNRKLLYVPHSALVVPTQLGGDAGMIGASYLS